jgi:hypothetical protein
MTSGLDRLLAGFGTARWLFGAWHGDWVPWNIAVTDDGVYAWDWEHFGLDAAAGLDVLHWHFQVSFIGRQRPLAESFRRAATSAAAAVAELQSDASVAPAAAMLYALEMTARQYRMYAGGGGWDPRYYPDAIGVLADVQREWLGA